MNRIRFESPNVSRYLFMDHKSKEAAAFFEGARAIMSTLQLMPAEEYASALSVRNNQHIIALLVRGEEQQQARRRNDARELLKIYDVDELKFAAFLLDLPKVNENCQAIEPDGTLLEDEMFRPLPGKTHNGWPFYKITHFETDSELSRAEYLTLNEDTQDEYCYRRYFDLTGRYGRPALRISDTDQYLMQELIRRLILTNNRRINLRLALEVHYFEDTVGKLYRYRDTIQDAFDELYEQSGLNNHAARTTMMTSQMKQGHISSMGQYLIAKVQSLITTARTSHLFGALNSCNPFEILDIYAIDELTRLIKICTADDDAALEQLITDQDIENYRSADSTPLPGAFYDDASNVWHITMPYIDGATVQEQKNYFKHILVLKKLVQKLTGMLDREINYDELGAIDPNRLNALRNLIAALPNGTVCSLRDHLGDDPNANK